MIFRQMSDADRREFLDRYGMDEIESRRFSVNEIANFFGVPASEIAHSETTTWGEGIKPLLDRLAQLNGVG